MTTITAKVIADSISPQGVRLTTIQLRYPRFIHAEFMTHRVFSRNASSSRAVPVERLIADVESDPVVPLFWGSNKPGMQAGEECVERVCTWDFGPPPHPDYGGGGTSWGREAAWLFARDNAVKMAKAFTTAGYHKQIVNRLLEPFSHINVVATATDWANFFALRCHSVAEPHMQMLAEAMRVAREASAPTRLELGQWHLPYVDPAVEMDRLPTRPTGDTSTSCDGWFVRRLIKLSVARCARVSYLTTEGKLPTVEADLALYERLVGAQPIHASAAEHQATPDEVTDYTVACIEPTEEQRRRQEMEVHLSLRCAHPELHGNLHGWIQHRKTLPNECVKG